MKELDNLKQWAERHKDDPDDYILNTFLTVGDLRRIIVLLERADDREQDALGRQW